tara:strand:+ start:681 stop:1784 length:1104 start_codon:yes stop_codon:yes gene_type:complete
MNKLRKKILLIGDNPIAKEKANKKLSGTYNFGGVGRSINNLANSAQFRKKFKCDLFDDNNNSSSMLGALKNSIVCLFSLSKKLKKSNYDLVLLYCNSVSFAFVHKFLVSLIVKISDTNLFVRYGGSSSFDFFSRKYAYFFFNLFFSMQKGLLVQGDTGKNFYSKLINKPFFKESNFVMNNLISENTLQNEKINKINIILTTGSDYKRKGFLVSLDSLPFIDLDDNFQVIAIGCNSQVVQESKKKNLNHKIKMYGDLNYSEVENIIKKCHILLLPSYKEGLPNLILEAMAKGLVVITTRVGSIPDVIVDSQNGFFVDIGNSKQISKILNSLFENKSKMVSISRNNINKVKKVYSEKIVIPKMIDFLIN